MSNYIPKENKMGKLKNTTAAAMALVEVYKLNSLKHQLKKDPENTKIQKKFEDSKRTFAVLAMEGFDEATLSKLIGEPIDAETVSE
jgi:cell fate (sporulation/competence/biofilm development) regulator YlbF (YheA/YmcA/DUF963 family)